MASVEKEPVDSVIDESEENYEQLEIRGLTGFVSPHGKYKDERPGFRYDAKSDRYTCNQGNHLAFDKVLVGQAR